MDTSPMLIDTHAHVNFEGFKDDAKEVLQRALDSGVWVVNVGSQVDTSKESLSLAKSFEQGVYAAVGLHPEHTYSQMVEEEGVKFRSREEVFDYEAYKKLAMDEKVVAIGECGLDYYWLPKDVDPEIINTVKEKQKEAFRQQVKLAKELGKALVIHSRPEKGRESELYGDILEILDEDFVPGVVAPFMGPDESGNYKQATGLRYESQLRFVVHSFTGTPEWAQKFLDRGGYISFNGIITFDKTGNMEALIKLVPWDRLLLETDSPFLAPIPNRGKRNEPSYVVHTAEKIAQIKNATFDEVALKTTENAKRLFQLP